LPERTAFVTAVLSHKSKKINNLDFTKNEIRNRRFLCKLKKINGLGDLSCSQNLLAITKRCKMVFTNFFVFLFGKFIDLIRSILIIYCCKKKSKKKLQKNFVITKKFCNFVSTRKQKKVSITKKR
jgi:hypothetical protein